MSHHPDTNSADPFARIAALETENALLRRELSRQKERAAEGERLSLLCEVTGIGVWNADLQHGSATVSPAQLSLYGLPPGSSLHFAEWLDRIHPQDRASVEQMVRAAFEAGTPFVSEYRILRADTGDVGWVQSRGFRVPGIGDAASVFAGFDMEVTDRRRAEEARQEQLAQLHATYRSAPVGLCLLDRELRYLAVNERLAKMNGLPASDHLGRTLREVVPNLADAAEPMYRHVLETGEPLQNVLCAGTTAAAPDENRQWLVNYYPACHASGTVASVSVAVLDVTDIRITQEHLSAALRAVEAADLAKTRFIAAMNHEFRTPISIVMGYAELLQQAAEAGEVVRNSSDHVREIYTASQHLLQLVEDASRYARTSLRTYAPVRNQVAVKDVIAAAVRIAARNRPEWAHTVELQSLAHGDAEIAINSEALQDGLASLLREVARRAPAGGPIAISWSMESAGVLIDVHFTGLLLSSEDLERLRAPLDPSDLHARGLEGASFGVAIAESAIRAHNGSLLVQSTPGSGTRFAITLPLVSPPGALVC